MNQPKEECNEECRKLGTHGHCIKCRELVQPIMKCKCEFRIKKEEWEEKIRDMFRVGNIEFKGLANDKLTPENLIFLIRSEKELSRREGEESLITQGVIKSHDKFIRKEVIEKVREKIEKVRILPPSTRNNILDNLLASLDSLE